MDAVAGLSREVCKGVVETESNIVVRARRC
jgi:hypothetical protein